MVFAQSRILRGLHDSFNTIADYGREIFRDIDESTQHPEFSNFHSIM